jgi:hypothetical protein
MKTKTFLFLIAVSALTAGVQKSSAATVPAGTILTVRTLRAVSAIETPGRAVPVQLERPVAIHGKVAIPAGTHLSGKVITSRRLTPSNHQLTVDLTSVSLAGRDVPITTTGAQLLSNDIQTRRGVSVSHSNYTVAAGKLMQFQLARPFVL